MAYNGTTAAATAQNVPIRLTWGGLAGGGFTTAYTTAGAGAGYASTSYGPMMKQAQSLWLYNTTDLTTQMSSGLSYFTDGVQLGMRPGDLLIGVCGLSSGAGSPYLKFINYVSTAGVGISTAAVV